MKPDGKLRATDDRRDASDDNAAAEMKVWMTRWETADWHMQMAEW